ncbi:hypothetical protein KFK14_13055 [Sphingobium phenoxybenzoativorans]|uniref:Uncharacterized protein n=1 Tax=Sphingobium phenoxybenzoativorans TaxID=1592790 RepID=A0A975PZL7_9SPHN|nr:hypothetical protein [Sphingobium phenoxybenzoativorans]QUT04075.1 hypothetical protein KFK14_13055 [Sphingobium phenoxybenzoativorans]
MAKAYITKYSNGSVNGPRSRGGMPLPVLGAQLGVSIDLDYTSGVQNSAALDQGLYEISIVGANARVAIGASVVADQTARFWRDGRDDVVFVEEGQRISVIAAT